MLTPGQALSATARLPAGAKPVSVMGVDYVRIDYPGGDEVYLTADGLPFAAHLDPRNFWVDQQWFSDNSRRLAGTSTIYRITTKTQRGFGKDIVLKWNRMGQDVVMGEDLPQDLPGEFNSPYEEFSLVYDLRGRGRAGLGRLATHKPLAIYVPGGRTNPEKYGRKDWLMQPKIVAHREILLDMHRNYAVIYEWIKGVDAAEACGTGMLSGSQMEELVSAATADLRAAGFVVGDSKPQHVIVRPDREGRLRRGRDGRPFYALVDFELLSRTQEYERQRRESRRRTYLLKQKARFEKAPDKTLPPHLHSCGVLGVNYIWGRVSTTGGALWVVGNEPELFEYFLPENWEGTPRKRLSQTHGMYYTLTKDHIHLVWKVSRVGQKPDADPFRENGRLVLEHGYNSPFEEFALALELNGRGVPTIYPRAVYMAGEAATVPEEMRDGRRCATHEALRTPDGQPVLRADRDYFMIWGYWNGPDEKLAALDGDYYEGISALHAYRCGVLSLDRYMQLVRRHEERLEAAGLRDLSLSGNHLLLSLAGSGELVRDAAGEPEVRICNFELLSRMRPGERPGT